MHLLYHRRASATPSTMLQAVLAFVFLAMAALTAQAPARADRTAPTPASAATGNLPTAAPESDDLAWLSTEERALLARNPQMLAAGGQEYSGQLEPYEVIALTILFVGLIAFMVVTI
ncbi:MAG: hypothetical protein JNK15_18175 [Planctomycetes bacterium]|nr:hypothetical protein [Planctomycetota bacterium]